ncbi:carbohydrate ABC transporter permease [Neglectibacter timonensis]|uniref:carbohydrate ABC transporter permease n=1 Tax=Neglectibacter timonensis TaxID=1776382 RepID=UPI0039948E03
MGNEKKRVQFIGHFIMILLSLCAFLPMALLVLASFTSNEALVRDGYSFFPREWSTEAYSYIFSSSGTVLRAYMLSFIVTALGTALSVILTVALAYPLSKKNLPGRGVLTFFVVFTMLFNGGLVPTYMNYTNVFGIKNTIWALIVPNLLMNAFNVLMVKSYFVSSLPNEILEAAYIDGASEFKTFMRIALPLAKPIIATVALFSGIAYWNDWNNGYVYLTKRVDLYTIQNLLNRMIQNIQFLNQGLSSTPNLDAGLISMPSVSVRMAIAVVGVLPILLIYPFVQKNFVKGITLGGVKG